MIGISAAPIPDNVGLADRRDRLDHLISLIAVGDRAAFRLLYAFMAMRVWRAAGASLGAASAIAVTQSTFVEVWYLAGAAIGSNARDWLSAVSARRINDRLRSRGPDGRCDSRADQPIVVTDDCGLVQCAADYETHIDCELNALLGDGSATVRIRSGPAPSRGSTISTRRSPSSPRVRDPPQSALAHQPRHRPPLRHRRHSGEGQRSCRSTNQR
jgi:hypothetical protein